MNDQRKGVIITVIAILALVPDSLFLRLVSADIMTFIFWRAAIASVMIVVGLCFFYGRGTAGKFLGLGKLGLLYAAFTAVGTYAFLLAIANTSVANALFIVSTAPVFAAITSRVFLGERFSQRMAWTTVFALIGIAVIASGSSSNQHATRFGDLVALAAAVLLACSFTTARAAKHISMVPAAALAYLTTAIVAAPFVDWQGVKGNDWIYLAVLGGMFVPLGTSFLSLGPRYITAAEVSLILLLEAVLAPLLVWYFLGENPGKWALLGGAIVLGTLLVSNIIGLRRAKA